MNNTPFNLYDNCGYWKIKYYDMSGRRRTKSLGAVKKLSKRKAKILAQRFIASVQVKPSLTSPMQAPTLGAYLDRYTASRTELSESSLKLFDITARYLRGFFGDECRISRINRAMAAAWKAALARGELEECRLAFDPAKKLAERTVYNHVVRVCTIFNEAVRQDLIPFNAFDRLRKTPRKKDKTWRYVSLDELESLLGVCPNVGWRSLIGLCRLAGLRRGETLSLEWTAVDWGERTIDVISSKTGAGRVVPMVEKLQQILLNAFDEASEGEPLTVPKKLVSRNNLVRNMHAIIKRAGLEPWPECYQVLRRNCATDWAGQLPAFVSAAWLGHSEHVEREHYLQVLKHYHEQMISSQPQPAGSQR